MSDQLSRHNAADEETWNLGDIYPDQREWTADMWQVGNEIERAGAFRGSLGQDAATLLAFLQARDNLFGRVMRTLAYAHLSAATDALSPVNQEMAARAGLQSARLQEAIAFAVPEVLALPEGTVESYLRQEPGLEPYRRQLHSLLLRRPHVLSTETEEALAALDEPLSSGAAIHHQVTATMSGAPIQDAGGSDVPVTIGSYHFGLSASPDRGVRRRAYDSLTDALATHKVALAGTLSASIQRDVVLARLRRYPSTVAMFLQPQEVPDSVYHTVIDAMHDEVAPPIRRLLDLRRRVLGLDRLEVYDLTAPLDPEFEPETTYEEGAHLLAGSLAPLGEEYGEILRTALRDRWIDRAEHVGRSAVPFCASVYGVHPYVLTVWNGRMTNAFVLAHEFGHAGHGHLVNRSQIISNAVSLGNLSSIALFIEVPSRVNELLLGFHLLDTARDTRLRRWAILHLLDGLVTSLRTTMLGAHLERRLFQLAEAGEPITLDTITRVEGEVFERFFGDTLNVDDKARLYWVAWPHYYSGTYNFTYPAGIACAIAIVDGIRQGGSQAANAYLNALRAGTTLPPLELASMAGVDLSDREPMVKVGEFFNRMIDELEASFVGAGYPLGVLRP